MERLKKLEDRATEIQAKYIDNKEYTDISLSEIQAAVPAMRHKQGQTISGYNLASKSVHLDPLPTERSYIRG